MLTCVVLAILTNSTPSYVVAVRERVYRRIVDAGGGVAVAAAGLAGEAVLRGPVAPGLVAVGGETRPTGRAHRVVLTLAHGVDLVATATRMTIAGTPEYTEL